MAGSTPLISILTVTYNNAAFIREAIDSVMQQTYTHWEWVLVDNGSTDQTSNILNSIGDDRIRVISLSENLGVSAGRNVALEKMRGDVFCFLDGDDVLPEHALQARVELLMKDDQVAFVDGRMDTFDDATGKVLAVQHSGHRGPVLQELLTINPKVFKGNTWMIRVKPDRRYKFEPDLTHAEELLFYMDMADQGIYDYTEECVLKYRKHGSSAMRNIDALDHGYSILIEKLRNRAYTTDQQVSTLANRIRWMMVKTYLKKLEPIKAIRRCFSATN